MRFILPLLRKRYPRNCILYDSDRFEFLYDLLRFNDKHSVDKTISQEKCFKETLKSGLRETYLDVFRYSLNRSIGKFNAKTKIKKRYVKRKVKYVHGLTCVVLIF